MNERDLETRLRSVYHSRAERTDPGALSERVHSIPATVKPERRRFWHGFRSDATRRVGLGGTQVKGAKNMMSATRIAAVVAALALGSTFLAVQVGGPPEVAPQPGAPASESWVIVTGSQVLVGESPDCAMTAKNQSMSDPRLEGEICISYETEDGGEEHPGTFWSMVKVTNDEGSWQGQSIGFSEEDGSHHHMGWLEGDGAYEGLVFIDQLTEANPKYPSAGVNLDVVGLLYEGELPPMVLPDWVATTD